MKIGKTLEGKRFSRIVAGVMVLAVLFFGLQPKGEIGENGVEWLPLERSLLFRPPAMAYARPFDHFNHAGSPNTFTIVIRFAPHDIETSGVKTLLMVHHGDDRQQLIVWQWGASLVVMNGDDYSYTAREPRIETGPSLTAGRGYVLAVCSGDSGTSLWLDGTRVATKRDLQLHMPTGRSPVTLVLGNSVYGNQGWNGRISEVAIYDQEGAAVDILASASPESPRKTGVPRQAQQTGAVVLYTFHDVVSRTILDQSGNNVSLQLPARVCSLHRRYLAASSWDSLTNTRMALDFLLNLVGFFVLSLGLCAALRQRQPVPDGNLGFIVVLFCLTLSLGMELAQAWIPGRYSSLLDVLSNGLGSSIGVLFARSGLAKISRPSSTASGGGDS